MFEGGSLELKESFYKLFPRISEMPIASLAEFLPEERHLSREGETPLFLHMLGMPGSGKTTFCTALLKAMERPFFYCSFDYLMENLPGYQKKLNTAGSAEAFKLFEEKARVIGYAVLHKALQKRAMVLFDHGGSLPSHVQLIRLASKIGYKTVILQMNTPPALSKKRGIFRQTRHVPANYYESRFDRIKNLIPAYQATADKFVSVPNEVSTQTQSNLENRAGRIWKQLKSLQAN